MADTLILEIKGILGLTKMKSQLGSMMQKAMKLFGMPLQDSKDQIIKMIRKQSIYLLEMLFQILIKSINI